VMVALWLCNAPNFPSPLPWEREAGTDIFI
jgi:hypothetical protein